MTRRTILDMQWAGMDALGAFWPHRGFEAGQGDGFVEHVRPFLEPRCPEHGLDGIPPPGRYWQHPCFLLFSTSNGIDPLPKVQSLSPNPCNLAGTVSQPQEDQHHHPEMGIPCDLVVAAGNSVSGGIDGAVESQVPVIGSRSEKQRIGIRFRYKMVRSPTGGCNENQSQ